MQSNLHVVMYHYVRDLSRSRFPRIKGLQLADFREQVTVLAERYEMASLESTMAYLDGSYQPKRDLCLLTFDDGLREHYAEVTPMLAERKIQGLFFLISGCQEDARVAPVHMNHFLTAELGFEKYSALFLERLTGGHHDVDPEMAARTYPWDSPDVAQFKYLFNFVLDASTRDQIVAALFAEHLGSEAAFSRELYLSWDEGRSMQNAGMALGGHTHRHRPLAGLTDEELAADLGACRRLLDARLQAQALWPFCYPYGKKDSFDRRTVATLRQQKYCCGFSTETGNSMPGDNVFAIRRTDCNRALSMPFTPLQIAAQV